MSKVAMIYAKDFEGKVTPISAMTSYYAAVSKMDAFFGVGAHKKGTTKKGRLYAKWSVSKLEGTARCPHCDESLGVEKLNRLFNKTGGVYNVKTVGVMEMEEGDWGIFSI